MNIPLPRRDPRPLAAVERSLNEARADRHALVMARDHAEHQMLAHMREVEDLELRIGHCDDTIGALLDEYLRAKASGRAANA